MSSPRNPLHHAVHAGRFHWPDPLRPPAYPIHLILIRGLNGKCHLHSPAHGGLPHLAHTPQLSSRRYQVSLGYRFSLGRDTRQTHSCSVDRGERTPAGKQVSAQRNACAEHNRVLCGPPQRGSFPGRFIKARLVSQGLAPLTQQRLESTLGW